MPRSTVAWYADNWSHCTGGETYLVYCSATVQRQLPTNRTNLRATDTKRNNYASGSSKVTLHTYNYSATAAATRDCPGWIANANCVIFVNRIFYSTPSTPTKTTFLIVSLLFPSNFFWSSLP